MSTCTRAPEPARPEPTPEEREDTLRRKEELGEEYAADFDAPPPNGYDR